MRAAAVTTNPADGASAATTTTTRRTTMTFDNIESRRLTTPSGRFLRTLDEGLAALRRPSLWIRPKQTVAWRESDGTLNHVYLRRWHVGIDGAPRITRIAVNHFRFDPSRRTLRVLSFHPSERPAWREDLHFELTVLDRELAAFGPWLPHWIAGRVDPARAIPEPPLPCRNWHKDWRTTDYAWTATAWDASRAWRAAEEAKEQARRVRRAAFLAGRSGTTSTTPTTAPAAPVSTTSIDAPTATAAVATEATR